MHSARPRRRVRPLARPKWVSRPGARGPTPKPKVRTLEPSALAMDKPDSPYAICDPSGDQCAPDSPVITSVKSEPSGAKV